LILNGTHQLLVYAGYVNTLDGSVHTIMNKREALVVVSLEIGLEVNDDDKTKYMVMSHNQDAGRSHDIKVDSSSFENVEEFKYLRTTLTNQNCKCEEIKIRLKSGCACYHSVQHHLSSSLQSKKFKDNDL
jgi:hypothetical protein